MKPHRGRNRIDLDALHRCEIDHKSAVAGAMAREAMTSAAHRDEKIIAMREVDRANDILVPGASRDDRRMQIDGMIPHAARAFVAAIIRKNDFTAEAAAEFAKRGWIEAGCCH